MTDSDLPARRLVAGAIGPERRPFRKDRDEPRWFEPLHVRAPALSRDALARSVAAGADVLVAPTWLTHRRALLPVGETRRAAAWTAAAVRLAREAAEHGLELRERAAEAAAEAALWALEGRDAHGDPLPEVERAVARAAAERARDADAGGARTAPVLEVPRNPVLVAGVLPFLGDAAELEAGRLAPRDAGVERDLRTAAGLLAEAGADLLLIEGGPVVAGARAAADAGVETGLPVWMTVPVTGGAVPVLPGGEAIESWAASMIHAGVAGFLLVPAPGCDVAGALERLRAAGVPAERSGVLPMAVGPSTLGPGADAGGAGAGTTAAEDEEPGPTWPWAEDGRRSGERGPGSTASADARAGVAASRNAETGGRDDRSSPGATGGGGVTPDDALEAAAVRWMEAGAWHVGLGDGATPERLARLRAAIDAVDGARLGSRAAARDRWVALVREAARRAPGGRAAWLGPRDAEVSLPGGFAWTELSADALGALPAAELRLVVAAVPLPGERLAALLESGGVLLARGDEAGPLAAAGLRILEVTSAPAATLARRDP